MSRSHDNDAVSTPPEEQARVQTQVRPSSDMIELRVDDRVVMCSPGQVLLNVLMNAGIPVETACGGKGTCHLCRVTLRHGAEHVARPNGVESRALGNVLLAQGMRLSCQICVDAPLSVSVPSRETPEQRRERIRQAKARRQKT